MRVAEILAFGHPQIHLRQTDPSVLRLLRRGSLVREGSLAPAGMARWHSERRIQMCRKVLPPVQIKSGFRPLGKPVVRLHTRQRGAARSVTASSAAYCAGVLQQHQAAVDHDRLTGDVVGIIGGQESGQSDDILGRRWPTQQGTRG